MSNQPYGARVDSMVEPSGASMVFSERYRHALETGKQKMKA
jgi:hypothetical protein